MCGKSYTQPYVLDERTYTAVLRVFSAVLTGIISALLFEIPLAKTWSELTYNALFCVLSVVLAISIERRIQI